MITRETLPDDAFQLKGIVHQLFDVLEEQKRLIANQNERFDVQLLRANEQSQKIEAQSQEIKTLYLKNEGQSQEIKLLYLRNEEQSKEIKVLCLQNKKQSQRIDQLSDQLNVLKRHRFGKRSEKLGKDDPTDDGDQSNNGAGSGGSGRTNGEENRDTDGGTTQTGNSQDGYRRSG